MIHALIKLQLHFTDSAVVIICIIVYTILHLQSAKDKRINANNSFLSPFILWF